ncbi:MAG TPA: ABC transporter ATP-binding protein [Propionibacteriaceae bacterium]|nr:ABC transporter ATP-binding protein [Propionibacteriaceae bacterium]
MIEINQLSKRFGPKLAVDNLTVTIQPGRVTGFLGPNGAGKSTTMRMIVGLDHPTGGEVLIHGRRYVDSPAPLRQVGALLDAKAMHPGRSAYHHLLALAVTAGIGRDRVREVLDLVGLSEVAGRRTRTFSLGMGQRLGIASALLGDPPVIMLDEPVNGLDPDGIHWIRGLLRALAAEGRTVFVSSHLMSEMALTADHLVILGRGRLLADVAMAEMLAASSPSVLARTPQADAFALALRQEGISFQRPEPQVLSITEQPLDRIAELAFAHQIVLHELKATHGSLEDAYLALTHDAVEYVATTPTSRRVA